jgi:anaerobic magnesium-protoporphyrin IX monomethyl ester cyclase
MLYSNQWVTGNKPIGLASLSAILKQSGHQFTLFDCTEYSIIAENAKENDRKTELGSKQMMHNSNALEFKYAENHERLPVPKPVTHKDLIDEFLRTIDRIKPDMIGFSGLTDDYPLGLGLMRHARSKFPAIPTIAGGIHATVAPMDVISEDCFDMVCIGEGEYVVLDIAERIDQKRNFKGIQNLWIKLDDRTIERNAVRPYEQNLDLLPFPDWSIYGDTAFFKPYLGHVYKYGDFEMSRGCPYKCSYCINVQLQEIYSGPHNFHREKSIDRVINEIKYAVDNYQIEFLKFWDETFLLMGKERMEEFGDKYSSEIGLPYVIETTAESITEISAKILKKTNCKSASLGMETGSPDIRKGILHKTTDNTAYVKAFKLMEENGIKKVSFNMIGLPNESQRDIFRTIGLNRLVGTFTQAVGLFYPYKGTPIRDMMVEQGWMGDDFELRNLQDEGYDFTSLTSHGRSVVRFKDMDNELVTRLCMLFATYSYWPVKLHPLIDYVKKNNDDFSVNLLKNIQRTTYYKKFGELPKSDTSSVKPLPMETQKVLSIVGQLSEPLAVEFSTLLAKLWVGNDLDRVSSMLNLIIAGELSPEINIPEEPEELAEWLDVSMEDDVVQRLVRSKLRSIAKENRATYQSAMVSLDPITSTLPK